MSIRYLGAKTRIIDELSSHFPEPITGAKFIDAFCGTGAVASAASAMGWDVVLNDNLTCAVMTARANLITKIEVNFAFCGGYENAVSLLNTVSAKPGFITQNYSPMSTENSEYERRYFTVENAQKIDSMREQVAAWIANRLISEVEATLLIADLLTSANRVANTAGTFGYYLSQWSNAAKSPMELRARKLPEWRGSKIVAIVGDANDLSSESMDVLYLDPPYTKRQYAAYYHVLETIALADEPQISGKSGLRDWKTKASPFSYKSQAASAFESLLNSTRAERILVSYSSDGLVPIDELSAILGAFGQAKVNKIGQLSRYTPNKTARLNGSEVTEYLISVQRGSRRHG